MIKPMEPVLIVDWDKVTHVRVTLEEPWLGGGLRWRQGTTEPRQNASFNAHDPDNEGPWYPGVPIMYPEDAPAIAGDPERDSFIMPGNINARVQSRKGEIIPDVRQHAAFIAFGYFMAPLTEGKRGVIGFTQSNERPRLAQFWHGFELPNVRDDSRATNRIGPPHIPKVALRPLTQAMMPLKYEGQEIVIRPYSFWKFDDPMLYDPIPEGHMVRGVKKADAAEYISGLTQDEMEALREMLKAKVAGAKGK
jgi:hypothetical protein